MIEQKQIQKKILFALFLKTSEENLPLLCCSVSPNKGYPSKFEVKRQCHTFKFEYSNL